jgi:hypothetical protein
MAALAERKVRLCYVVAGERFRWGGASWEMLNPREGEFTGGAREAASASIVYVLRANAISAAYADSRKASSRGRLSDT